MQQICVLNLISFTKKLFVNKGNTLLLRNKLILGLVTFSICFIGLRFTPRHHWLQKTSASLLYPVLVSSNAISSYIQAVVEEKKSYTDLNKDYQSLRLAHEVLLEAFIKVRGSLHHYEDSKELTDFQKRYNFNNAHVAKILNRTITQQEHSCFINKGARDGIKENMIAFYKLQIVGRVSEVYDFHSKLIFLTDKRSKVAAFTNETNAQGILTGTNAPTCKLEYVSHLAKIENQDLLFSSGEGLIFPEGFCLGKIINHELTNQALHYSIDIEPLVDFTEIKYCLLTNQSTINLF